MDTGHLTARQYEVLCALSTYIDITLFGSEQPLGPVLLTFSRPGPNSRAIGFFKPHAWRLHHSGRRRVAAEKYIGEIALCPEGMFAAGLPDLITTLVHEKCHQWQLEYGEPPRGGYHDAEWAGKMESVGLTPSVTGKPGGRRTGDSMDHYVTPGGPLESFLAAIPDDLQLPLLGADETVPARAKPSGYARFECPGCRLLARARPTASLICSECSLSMVAS